MSHRSLTAALSLSAAAAALAVAGPASASTLTLHAGDTFTTGHSGVVCQVETGGGINCMTTTARIPGMTAAKQRATCGSTALQGVTITQKRWDWLCGTGMTVLPGAKTNAWAASHHLSIDGRTHAAIIPNGWSFTTGAVNGHVSSNGALGLASGRASGNGFVANGTGVYVRGV